MASLPEPQDSGCRSPLQPRLLVLKFPDTPLARQQISNQKELGNPSLQLYDLSVEPDESKLVRNSEIIRKLRGMSLIFREEMHLDARALELDLHHLKRTWGELPAIVFVRVGGWSKGSRVHHAKIAQSLAARGFVTATITVEKDDPSTRAEKLHQQMTKLNISNDLTIIKDAPHPYLKKQIWLDQSSSTISQVFKVTGNFKKEKAPGSTEAFRKGISD